MTAGTRPRVLVVHHEARVGTGRLRPGLAAVAVLDERRPDLGDLLPEDLAGYAGLVVLGGTMGAGDDDVAPWLPATRRLLAEAVDAGLPTLGICLGAQLLAAATGGRVERGAAGPEVGLVRVRLSAAGAADPLLAPVAARLGDVLTVPQFHEDAVTELPPGAVLLAGGERYPHQAFRVGPAAWGLQYHPEVAAADFASWVRDGHGLVRAAGLDPAEVCARYAAAEATLGALAEVHAAAFAALPAR